jgi:hypothetical protein
MTHKKHAERYSPHLWLGPHHLAQLNSVFDIVGRARILHSSLVSRRWLAATDGTHPFL